MSGFSGSYDPADITFLLTPLDLPVMTVAEKEALLRAGQRHYSEVLSAEAPPSEAYLAAYRAALAANGARLAGHIKALAAALAQRTCSPAGLALTSFARAGTPVGVLLRRELVRLGVAVTHYSVSIVRDRGIDPAALDHVLARHAPDDVVFLDGWTGKGTISRELRGSTDLPRLGVEPFLVVVADPGGQAELAATGEDYLIPSGILNGIVSGLVSRSAIVPELRAGQFHACRMLHELVGQDLSRSFVDQIDAQVEALPPAAPAVWTPAERAARGQACTRLVERMLADHALSDVNRIKPGLAEATRAVLRRQPRALLVSGPQEDSALDHLLLLCGERSVPVTLVDNLEGYRAVAILD